MQVVINPIFPKDSPISDENMLKAIDPWIPLMIALALTFLAVVFIASLWSNWKTRRGWRI